MSKKMSRRNFVKGAFAGAAASAIAAPVLSQAADKKTIRLRMQSYWGKEADGPFGEFTDSVKVASEKQVRIKRFAGGAIVPDADMIDAVSKGTLDMCETYGGYYPGKVDMAVIESGIPGAWSNYDEATYLFENGLHDLVSAAYAEKNIKYLGVVMGGPFDLLTKNPVNSLEDLKKMKIRATPNVAKILAKFDIPSVFLPASELYIALSTGTIDGVIYGGPTEYVGMKLFETAKYYTKLNMLQPGFTDNVLMNMDKWNSLSDANKEIIQLSVNSHATNMNTFMMNGLYNPDFTGKFEFGALPAEDSKKLRETAQVLWDEEAKKSERTKKAVDLLKAFNK